MPVNIAKTEVAFPHGRYRLGKGEFAQTAHGNQECPQTRWIYVGYITQEVLSFVCVRLPAEPFLLLPLH